uniref:Fibronectin type III domain-containing protein n=1 Tax=Candidatus Kentrum eta TaxID=2126337 RepID=A0A450U5B2_9GAMM|nr:MAG: Fibronectin type III domain-containing protein [Candidatus Kentron sp. H]VFJ88191.1 MAG: Fibronectin type III domain-containing protein [Candidatus Kentron sp. H]VFJ95416.1 MAG: Fibronectin type III domain-containing protein [Candidatus Kentron sp. H]
MATFPIEESKLFKLAEDVSSGLKTHPDLYPSPPVDPVALDETIAAYKAAKDASITAHSAAEQSTTVKKEAMHALAEQVKINLRYAEMAVGFDDAKLKALGWGGRRERTPLAAPGQVVGLVSVEQGDDWIVLAWEKPNDGGKVANYEVRCRERAGEADYRTVETTTSMTVTLENQERGKELEYVVAAANRAGKGLVSNAVMAVL